MAANERPSADDLILHRGAADTRGVRRLPDLQRSPAGSDPQPPRTVRRVHRERPDDVADWHGRIRHRRHRTIACSEPTRFGPEGHQATFGLWLAPDARSGGTRSLTGVGLTLPPRRDPPDSHHGRQQASTGWWSAPDSGVRRARVGRPPTACPSIASCTPASAVTLALLGRRASESHQARLGRCLTATRALDLGGAGPGSDRASRVLQRAASICSPVLPSLLLASASGGARWAGAGAGPRWAGPGQGRDQRSRRDHGTTCASRTVGMPCTDRRRRLVR